MTRKPIIFPDFQEIFQNFSKVIIFADFLGKTAECLLIAFNISNVTVCRPV